MARPLFTPEQHSEFLNILQTNTVRQTAAILSEKYEKEFTYKQLHSYMTNHKIHAVVKEQHKSPSIFSAEQQQFIIDYVDEYEAPYMAQQLNEKFGTSFTAMQVKHWKRNHNHTSSVLTGACNIYRPNPHKGEKGWCIPNGENTRFKKGQSTNEVLPLFTIRQRPGAGNYLFIKVAQPNKWIAYHDWLWEQAYGPLKPGEKLKFINNDPSDVRLENLMLINNFIQGKLYGGKGASKLTEDPEMNKAIINTAKIEYLIKEKGEGRK